MLREAALALCILGAALAAAPPVGAMPLVQPLAHGPYTGFVAEPADPSAAIHLVVILKGVNHVAADHVPYLEDIAARGAVGFALDYDDFDADFGAAGALDVADALLRAHPSITTVTMVGISGGMPAGALALGAGATKPDGSPLFDYLIDIEGVSSLVETYAEARAAFAAVPAAGEAVWEIEAECGSPADMGCLVARSAAARGADIKTAGLKGAFLVHAVNDGLVPYNQGVEFDAALRAAGVPSSLTTVLRTATEDSKDTQATEYATGPARLPDVDLAGHATETHRQHLVVATGLAALFDLLENGVAPGTRGPAFVDRDLGRIELP